MDAYRTEKVLTEDGTLHLDALPFQKGESVEIVVRVRGAGPDETETPSVAGAVRRHDRPTEPVAEGDWDVLR